MLIEIKRVLNSVSSYREQCGYPRDKKDMTFRAGWRPSCEELFVLVEGIIFDCIYDGHLKCALKASSSAADAVTCHLKELLEPLAKTAESEEAGDNHADDQEDDAAARDAMPKLKRLREADGADSGTEEPVANPEDMLTQAARRLISTHTVFIADKGGPDQALAEQIAGTKAGKFQCNDSGISMGKGSVLLLLDPGNMTESSSHPHLRKAQIPQQLIDRAVNVGLIARSIARTGSKDADDTNDTLCPEDLWLLFDGGRQVGNPLSECDL